jgi:hypothetical protein
VPPLVMLADTDLKPPLASQDRGEPGQSDERFEVACLLLLPVALLQPRSSDGFCAGLFSLFELFRGYRSLPFLPLIP